MLLHSSALSLPVPTAWSVRDLMCCLFHLSRVLFYQCMDKSFSSSDSDHTWSVKNWTCFSKVGDNKKTSALSQVKMFNFDSILDIGAYGYRDVCMIVSQLPSQIVFVL